MNGTHPSEIVPGPLEDVVDKKDGFQEIRTRRDSALTVGLYIKPEVGALVVAFAGAGLKPYVFEVARDEANQAFDEPYRYAPIAGRLVLEEVLAAA